MRQAEKSWRWYPACCGCVAAAPGVEGGEAPTTSEAPDGHHDLQPSAGAAGSETKPPASTSEGDEGATTTEPPADGPPDGEGNGRCTQCKAFCRRLPESTWNKWNPPCCACKADDGQVAVGLDAQPGAGNGSAIEEGGEGPDENETSGSCAGYCKHMAERYWKWNHPCRGCATSAAEPDDGGAVGPGGSEAEEEVGGGRIPAWCRSVPQSQRVKYAKCSLGAQPPADDAEDGTKVGEDGIDHSEPKWCRFIPAHLRVGVCSSGTCKCKDMCVNIPPGAQASSPECCGCHTAIWDKSDTEDSELPDWCKLIPARYRKGKCLPEPTNCQCVDWCASEPAASQAMMPECCACPEAVARFKDTQGPEVQFPQDEKQISGASRLAGSGLFLALGACASSMVAQW